ncbi:hypothetical protein ABTY96_33785 [Streptomyces sp. NPDC096057]|uniref:pPIWI_RE_Y domain-containing protein n=1 Tax=Streptomyces sp. NPDC096057 TaxID=3155543 RepID=UPI00331C0960
MTPFSSTATVPRSGKNQEDGLFLTLARAVTILAECDGLRSLSLPYPKEAQLALDRAIVHCLDNGWTPPKSLPELLSWCTQHRMGDTRFGLSPAPVTQDARWIDPVGLVPTRTSLELAPVGRPGRTEQDAIDSLAALEHKCRSIDGYSRCRQFLAHHPLITQEDRFDRRWRTTTWNKVRDLYEHVPEALVDHKKLVLCGSCGLPTRTRRDERESGPDTWCEGEDCPPGVPFRLLRNPAQCLILRRSLRAFLVTPARTEQDAMDEVGRLGLGHHLLVDSGLGTHHITGSQTRDCLVQVHDRHQPARLAGRISEEFSRATHPVLVVVPRRLADREGYRVAFETALSRECREQVTLTTPDDLERHLYPRNPPSDSDREDTHA